MQETPVQKHDPLLADLEGYAEAPDSRAEYDVSGFYNLSPEDRQVILDFQDFIRMNSGTFEDVEEAIKNRKDDQRIYVLGNEAAESVKKIRKTLRDEIITWEVGRTDMFYDFRFLEEWKRRKEDRQKQGLDELSAHEMYTQYVLSESDSKIIMVISKNFFNYVADLSAQERQTLKNQGEDLQLATIREFNYLAQHMGEYDLERFIFIVE